MHLFTYRLFNYYGAIRKKYNRHTINDNFMKKNYQTQSCQKKLHRKKSS